MNIDNEILINAFKEEMVRSNHSSKWWNDHLSEQITDFFRKNLESSTKESIISSARSYINSGSLATSQYFYNTKELSDKKLIFASANINEKRNIYNQINKEDRESIINNNENLDLKDIYDILTSREFEYGTKKEIANLLDDKKIRSLKENYVDLAKLLKEWLGKRYEMIFGNEKLDKEAENIENGLVNNSNNKEDDVLGNYMNSVNKIAFFNNIFNMQDKQNLFAKLDNREKRSIINNKDTQFLKAFYNNYPNKEELISLMNRETMESIYKLSGIIDRELISNYLSKKANEERNNVDKNLGNINKETRNINKYYQEIDRSKANMKNLKKSQKETNLNIKNSKVTIKKLEKRKDRLERKLTNTILRKSSRISFISKRRLAKIQRLSNEINLTNNDINNSKEQLEIYSNELNNIEANLNKEKNNIKDNKDSIRSANLNIQSYARKMYNSKIQIKDISNFHKYLIGKKRYDYNKNNPVIVTSKNKTDAIASAYTNPASKNNSISNNSNILNNIKANPNSTNEGLGLDKNNINFPAQKPSKVSQNQKKVEEELNKLGITYNHDEYVAKNQNSSYLPLEKITSMSYTQAKMMQLYFEAEYARKMIEITKLQQEVAMKGRSRTLSMSGFSNILILLLSLTVLILLGAIIFRVF